MNKVYNSLKDGTLVEQFGSFFQQTWGPQRGAALKKQKSTQEVH